MTVLDLLKLIWIVAIVFCWTLYISVCETLKVKYITGKNTMLEILKKLMQKVAHF